MMLYDTDAKIIEAVEKMSSPDRVAFAIEAHEFDEETKAAKADLIPPGGRLPVIKALLTEDEIIVCNRVIGSMRNQHKVFTTY